MKRGRTGTQAAGNWDGALSEFSAARSHRVTPDAEELFLAALAHERAGRVDSALVWYEQAVASRFNSDPAHVRFYPAAIKRYAEQLGARTRAAELRARIAPG